MTHGTSWEDQWARIIRWRERIRAGRDRVRDDDLGTEGYRDEVFTLMQAIWHLKDWLINDTAVKADKSAVERVVADRIKKPGTVLGVAADIANGSKHMSLNRTPRAGGSEQTRNDVHIFVGQGMRHTFYIQDGRSGSEYEAVDLADRCLQDWRTILAELGCRPPDV